MAVAFDAVSNVNRANGGADPITWTHTPVGTPRGVIVGISRSTNGTGVVSSVTYGGVAMTHIGTDPVDTTETGQAELWFLGSGIPTGAQTVSVDLSLNGTNHFHCSALTVTASLDTEVIDIKTAVSASGADPQVTLTYGGKTALAFAKLWTGLNTPPTTMLSGCTSVGTYDPGNATHATARQTTAGTSNFTIGWTAAADDYAIIGAAISEAVTVVSGSFTADAYIKATVAGSFTADANIKNTVAGSFTADAYIQNTISGSFTADAEIAAAPSVTTYAADDFSDDQTDSWGSADVGGAWTVTGTAADYDKVSGVGQMSVPSATTREARLNSMTAVDDQDGYLKFKVDQITTSTSTGVFWRVGLRGTNSFADGYRLEFRIGNGGVIQVLIRRLDTSVVTTLRTDSNALTGISAGDWIGIRWQLENSGSNVLIRYKLWNITTGGSEPGSWNAGDYTDTTPGNAFNPGVMMLTSQITSNYNGSFPNVFYYDDLNVTSLGGAATTYSGSFTADAHISKNGIAGSFTADANISKTGIAGSFTADAYIKKTLSGTFTADAYIQKTTSGTFTADANIKNTIGQTFTADAYIKQTFSQTFTADAYIKQTFPGSFTADAYVKKTIASTFTADANIKSTVAGSFTADAYVKNTIGGTFTADAEISAQAPTTVNGSFTADAYIAKTTAGSFTADANIKATIPGTFTADAYVKSTLAGSFTANANIKNTLSGTFTADAYIKKTLSGTLTADAYILRTFSGSFTADANIKATVSQTFTADATIAIRVPGSFTADAYIRQTTAGSFTADAYVRNTLGGTFTADAYVKNTVPGSFTADAYVRATLPGSFTADAYILKTTAGNFTADAEISRVGRIVWTTPGNGDSITNTPTFSFVIPQATGNIFFHIELDTVNTFDGVNYRSYKSAFDQTGWEYFNGATWVAVPASGVSNSFAGNEARFSPPSLTTATWYRRIRGGV